MGADTPAMRSRVFLLAATLLALGVAGVGFLLSSRGGAPVAKPNPTAPAPSAIPGPTPRSTFFDLVPPTTMPSPLASSVNGNADVVYAAEGTSGLSDTFSAFDWSGATVGTLDLPGGGGGAVPSPDGRFVQLLTTVFTVGGQPATPIPSQMTDPVWSDDSRHLCGVDTAGHVRVLSVYGPFSVSANAPDLGAGQVSRSIGCDTTSDVFLAEQQLSADPSTGLTLSVVAVAPSSGSSLGRRVVCAPPFQCQGASAMSAHDGRSVVVGGPGLALSVVDVLSGATHTLSARGRPEAITWDGRRALIQLADPPTPGPPDSVRGLALVDLVTGASLWTRANTVTTSSFTAPRPGGQEVMVGVSMYAPSTGVFPPGNVSLIVLDRFGHQRIVRAHVVRVAGPWG